MVLNRNVRLTRYLINHRRSWLALAVALAVVEVLPAAAAPAGGSIVGGAGSITQQGAGTKVIQNTARLAIEWDKFDIGADECVEFIQPNQHSIALNRVLGNDASHIHGSLRSNGQVVLVNPNGVFFSQDARVDVGGLVASGLDFKLRDFAKGKLVFKATDKSDASVVNQGIIQAAVGGNVALLGKQVANEGVIEARLGSVALAAGREAVLSFDPQGLLGVRVSKALLQKKIGGESAVVNSGEITALGGRVLLTASASQAVFSQAVNSGDLAGETEVLVHTDGSFTLGNGASVVSSGRINLRDIPDPENFDPTQEIVDPVPTVGNLVVLGANIDHSGVVDADSYVSGVGGKVVMAASQQVAVRGGAILSSGRSYGRFSGGSGGEITLVGNAIELTGGASLRAEGDGGGKVTIGGEGSKPRSRLVDTQSVLMDASSAIYVGGSQEQSTGGEIAMWAREALRVSGTLDASALHYDAGSVRLESEGLLGYDGTVFLAGIGAGKLHLQARDVRVTADAEDYSISQTALNAALTTGNVTLAASNQILFGEPDAGINMDVYQDQFPHLLSLKAGGAVTFHDSTINLNNQWLAIATGVTDLIAGGVTDTSPDLYLNNSALNAYSMQLDILGRIVFRGPSGINQTGYGWD